MSEPAPGRTASPPSHEPPFLHLALFGAALLLLLIGGEVLFASWGSVQVRLISLYALGAIVLHAAAKYAGQADPLLRAGAWLAMIGGAVHSGVLARVEVIGPLVALAAVDLILHTRGVDRPRIAPTTLARAVAATASLIALGLTVALVLLSQTTLIMVRLTATVVVGWALITLLALRPEHRTTPALLGASGAFGLSFLLLAAPVLPFGPLLAYWVAILSVATAVVTATLVQTSEPIDPGKRVHAQRIRPLPDPIIGQLRETVRSFLSTGAGARELSRRIEASQDRDEDGRLLPALAEAQAKGTRPSRADRRRALAELLEIDELPPTTEDHA